VSLRFRFRRRTHVLLIPLLVLLSHGTAFAQYKIDAWTTEQGLPQSTVTATTQSPDGFLWSATLGGLARFDGLAFRVYDTVTNPELPSSRLSVPVVDRDGQFWVTTEDHRVLRFANGRFEQMGPAHGLPDVPFTRLTKRRGIVGIENSQGTFIWQDGRFVPDTRPGPPASAGLRFIGDAFGGARWFVDPEGRAFRYDEDRLTRTASLPVNRSPIMYEDRAGRVWMLDTRNGRLLCQIGDTVRTYGPKDGVRGMSTMWVLEDPDGTLWFAESMGLVRYRDGRFRTFTTADGLPSDYVISVFRDREGTHWASTQGGLARLTEQPITTYSVANGLAARNTYPILQDRRGDIWIGGWQGLTRFRNGIFENVTRTESLVKRNVYSLFEDRDGGIWVSGGRGAERLTIGPRGEIHTTVMPWSFEAYAISQTRNGDLWFGAPSGAIRYRNGTRDPPLAGTANVNTFYEDTDGALWIGSAAGLARYQDGVLTAFHERDGFTGRRVRMIYADAGGTLWIGTYDTGLFRYRDGAFVRFTTSEGLPSNGAFQILEDAQARFWISSNTGIYRVAKSELDDVAAGRGRSVTAVRYGRDDGMLNQECNGLGRPAGVRAADGKLWFPTQDGVAVIDPTAMIDRPAPLVSILDVAVDGVPASSRDRIEIRSGSRALDVHFAAMTFVRPELAAFKYRMEGLEPEWHVTTGADRIARYARLPYGNFRFHVIAANRDGVWNDEGATIPIEVVPPFWRASWFIAVMSGLVLTVALGVFRLRLAVLERRRALQEAFARQLIDSQETDRKRIASELHDGVSQTLVVIRNWSQISEKTLPDDSPARKRLVDIAGAASQALGEVREVVQDLVPYHLERLGLVEAIRDAAARIADASGIAITCDLSDPGDRLSKDTALRLFRVVQEGLNNMVKHSKASTATLALALDGQTVRLTMTDNGRGFVPDAVTPTTSGDGFGLVGMSERTRMMGGTLTIQSSPGQGTTITIAVPS
jgi:signal transduction histidine kinase/streptogramin lyase